MSDGQPGMHLRSSTLGVNSDKRQSRKAFTSMLPIMERPSSSPSPSQCPAAFTFGSASGLNSCALSRYHTSDQPHSHFKCFRVTGLHPLCGSLFTVGFALREYGAFHYLYSRLNLVLYIVSQVFIYVCPWVIKVLQQRFL